MKRGFLNTARSKRVIEEAYAPQSPPRGRPKPSDHPSPSLSQKSSQTPNSMPHSDSGSNSNKLGAAKATVPEDDAMDIEPAEKVLQEVYADGHIVAVRLMQSTPQGEAGNPSVSPRTQDGDKELAPARDMADAQMTELQDVYVDGLVVGVRMIKPTINEVKTAPESREDNLSTQAEMHHTTEYPKGKSQEKVVGVVDGDATNTSCQNNPIIFLPPRALRRNLPGWGRHPDEEFFHTVPSPSHGGPRKKRAVFRIWPHSLKGKPIGASKSYKGTLSPDGYPWAATLYDIFYVNKSPDVPSLMSIETGSAIREAVEAMGELNCATREIEWVRSESKLRVEGAASTEELIKCLDWKRSFPFLDIQEMERRLDGEEDEEDIAEQVPMEDDDDNEDATVSTPPGTLSFHPKHEFKGCSFIPFENQLSILLQERIPLYLLPQTLYVHDPFYLLTACKQRFDNTSWTSRPDTIRTYNLYLSETTRKECEDKRKKAEELDEFKARTLIFLRYQRTKEQIENYEPMIEVQLPPYPRRPTKVEDSHLYLSPVAKVGKGHHSIVYKGEWELPRDIFVKQRICSLCFKESVDKEVQRLMDTGRWDKILRAASWGPNGFTGRQPELDEVDDLTDIEVDGDVIEREIICVVPPNANPSKVIEMIDQTKIWEKLKTKKKAFAARLDFTGDEESSRKDSHVAVVRIDPPFSYESQKSCIHQFFQAPVPRTAIFSVVAKLSLKDDPHLDREANNYQMFPEHFFEHYNGYTVIRRLRSVVPVNAVVPQFYGYYTPETSKTKGETAEEPDYLSPILLLEHCGEPINPRELSQEDQEECVSLLMRFQRSGWLHESVATRNFLVQRGKPTEFPLTRTFKPELSFRLIDFGRSRKSDKALEKQMEEIEALDIFDKLSDSLVTCG